MRSTLLGPVIFFTILLLVSLARVVRRRTLRWPWAVGLVASGVGLLCALVLGVGRAP